MKAFVLFFLLSGEPVMLRDYDTMADCTSALTSAKLSLDNKDAAQHRCAARADFEFGVALARQRRFEEWTRSAE